ncbi:helix-turn-helix domain-containing protein, partial [Mycolicibacillus parakoreensis]|nr:helix-turn-helix domain-containing protein [Mycolicibacillus parakoreensis]
ELFVSGHSQADAARLLGRSRSTISREAPRGATSCGYRARIAHSCGYRARIAQDTVDAARARPKVRKVVRRLKLRHSPEQIMRRLRQDFPDDPEMRVSHETIYQAIYVHETIYQAIYV